MLIVVEAVIDGTTRRAVVPAEALSAYEARGWVAIGPTSEPTREPIESDGEAAARYAAESAALAALVKADKARGRA